jgi:hypothetical protein
MMRDTVVVDAIGSFSAVIVGVPDSWVAGLVSASKRQDKMRSCKAHPILM